MILTVFKILKAALGAKDKKTANGSIETYSSRAQPPNHRITKQVNLAMIPNPEVLQTPIRKGCQTERK